MRIFPSIIKCSYLPINYDDYEEDMKMKINLYVIFDFFSFIYDYYYFGEFLINDLGKGIVKMFYLFLLINYIIILCFYYKYYCF